MTDPIVPSKGSRPRAAAAIGWMLTTLVVASGCGGGTPVASPAAPSPPATASASPTARPTSSGASASPSGLLSEDIQIDVKGTIGGHAVSGRLANASFTIACVGAGANQILTVHWIGDAPPNTPVQGEIDFKPGTWTLGSASAQGSATIGIQGGKAIDALVGTSGTVTTAPSGGTIGGTFTGGSDALQVTGRWTCPGT